MKHAWIAWVALLGLGGAGLMSGQSRTGTASRPLLELRGEYLGQRPPGLVAERFATGIVSTEAVDSVPVFSPEGDEAYWSRIGPDPGIFRSRRENGVWTAPEKAPFCGTGVLDVTPAFFDKGRQLLFLSTRALPDGRKPQPAFFTFWITTRQPEGWSDPVAIDSFFSGWDDFSAIAEDGTLYVRQAKAPSGIVRVARRGGRYRTPEPLSPPIEGFPALVGPDERYLIVGAALEGGYGDRDLYVLFRLPDGTWGNPLNLGPGVNSAGIEHLASLSADGKYLFFSSDRIGSFDVYWIDARVIDDARR